MNFRADRARQLTRALTDPAFRRLRPRAHPQARRSSARSRATARNSTCRSRSSPQRVDNGFGEYIAERGLRQLRIAETEKYAHVTYFFNGGVEAAVSRRGAHPGAVAQGRDLRSAAGDERGRSHRQAGRGDSITALRRHRLQLRQRRHGRTHRHPGRPRSGRSKPWTRASGASSRPCATSAARS